MSNWYKKIAQNWFNRSQLGSKSRYSFSISGDVFVEEQEDKEQEKMVAQELLTRLMHNTEVSGVRINSYNVEPYQRVF